MNRLPSPEMARRGMCVVVKVEIRRVNAVLLF
jgi:hypothetical protein